MRNSICTKCGEAFLHADGSEVDCPRCEVKRLRELLWNIAGSKGMKVEEDPQGVKVIVPTDRYGEADQVHIKVTDEGIVVDAISEGKVVETMSSMWEELFDGE